MTFRVTAVTWRFELLCCEEYRTANGTTAVGVLGEDDIVGVIYCPECGTEYRVAQPVEILPTAMVKREVNPE